MCLAVLKLAKLKFSEDVGQPERGRVCLSEWVGGGGGGVLLPLGGSLLLYTLDSTTNLINSTPTLLSVLYQQYTDL